MSLWTKAIENISYTDVVDFCANKTPEGTNLDYKADVPDKLAKTVSSMANTFGGLILIGVTTDDHNRPDKIIGVANERGFTETVANICRDAIFPSVLPEMTSLLPIAEDPAKAVAVLRVAQSPEAPHAVTKEKNHIFTRRNDVTDCMLLADIDRIAYLLDRRKQLTDKREECITRNHERFTRFIGPDNNPVVWWHAGPYYPWQSLCTAESCLHSLLGPDLRRAPNGAIGVGEITKRPRREGRETFVSADACGQFYRAELFVDQHDGQPTLHVGGLFDRSFSFFSIVQEFYRKYLTDFPGYIALEIGFDNVAKHQMKGRFGGGGQFPDKTFRADQVMRFDEFISADFSAGAFSGTQMMRNILHAFGLNPDHHAS